MADKIINTIKPILLDELTKKIEENKDKFNVVEDGIDDIIKKVKEIVEPISSPIVAGMKLIPFGNPSERLQELADDLKLKMDGIDLSELEKIPDLTPEITIRVKALPQKVKDKLKRLVDDLVSGTPTVEPATTATKAEPAKTPTVEPTITPTAEPAKTPTAEPTITATAEPTITATAEPTITATVEEKKKESIEEGLSNMPNDDKKETIDKIMKMLEDTGILDEIKKRICTAPVEAQAEVVQAQAEVVQAVPTNNANPNANPNATAYPVPAAGGANKKHRRKTKKNIRRQKRTYTKFGRNF